MRHVSYVAVLLGALSATAAAQDLGWSPFGLERDFSVGETSVRMGGEDLEQDILPIPSFYIGLRLGYNEGKDADEGNFAFGGEAALFLIEGYLGFRALIDYTLEQEYGGALTAELIPIKLSAMLRILPGSPFNPYAFAGVGWYKTNVELLDVEISSKTEFGWHLGGGLAFGMGGAELAAELDYNFLQDDVPGSGDSFDYWQGTIGLRWGF